MLNNKLANLRRNRQIASYSPIDQFFADSFLTPFVEMNPMLRASAMRTDVKEMKDCYLIEAELPGVSKEQIEVSVQNDILTITANVNAEKSEDEEQFIYSERTIGRSQRSFALDGVRQQDIQANYDNGLLRLILPKEDKSNTGATRHIEIQ